MGLTTKVTNIETFAMDRRSTGQHKLQLLKHVSKLRKEGINNQYVVSKEVTQGEDTCKIWYIVSEDNANDEEKMQISEIKNNGGKGKGKGAQPNNRNTGKRPAPYGRGGGKGRSQGKGKGLSNLLSLLRGGL